jgi:hypothetical protein
MGGWLWFRLTRPALGWALNPVQRLSSYSTLWAILSLLVLYHLILRATRGNWAVAALSTAFYAVTYFFWFYSVTTEQYTSAVFQTLLIVWLAFAWDDAQTRGARGDGYLLALAFVLGTCLANLVTTLFIAPPLAWFVLSRRPDLMRRPRLILAGALLAVLPVLSYAYVYVRGAAHPEWRGEGQWPSSWAWFLDFVTTQQGRDELAPGLTLSQFFTDEFPALVWGELTWIVLIGGLLGTWWLGRRRAMFVYSTLAIYLLFAWLDRFGNWFQVVIPAYPLLVLGFAAGLNALWSACPSLFDGAHPSLFNGARHARAVVRGLIVAGLLGLVVFRLAVSLPRADQSGRPEDTGLDPGWAVLADDPPPNSVIVGDHDEWLALSYLTHIWGARPPVDPRPLCEVDAPGADAPGAYLTRRAAAGDPACLADGHRYAAGATLIKVQPDADTALPDSARPASLGFGPVLALVGYQIHDPPPTEDGTGWHISLYWRAAAPLEHDYTVSVRPLREGATLLDTSGAPLIQDHQPVWNSYPTSRWSPGEVVRDDYLLSLPDGTLPDGVLPDGMQIVVYRASEAGGFENLGGAQLDLSDAAP